MSNQPIIEVKNLGKRYRLGAGQRNERYTALRDVLAEKARGLLPRRQNRGTTAADPQEFWALKDVSFSVKPGEVVGIIGRNGAGKSTLLKILSRITEPTEGRITLRGRVASLLEVGTGFHPELTGRENIFLNGAVLGMQRAEIKAKFEEIVAFAEVERFLDTPVKRYSSGMYVRLAFAVAAHLEPEILIVDEVLAVGDAEFQKKCLGKMESVAKGQGRTVLFVSHNLGAIRRLCTKGILFNRGCLVKCDAMSVVIDSYLNSTETHRSARYSFPPRPGGLRPAFTSIEIRSGSGEYRNSILAGEPFEIVLSINNPQDTKFEVVIGVEVLDQEAVSLFTSHSDDVCRKMTQLPPGVSIFSCIFQKNLLMPGDYNLQLGLVDKQWSLVDFARPEIFIRIEKVPLTGFDLHLLRPGRLILELPWKIQYP